MQCSVRPFSKLPAIASCLVQSLQISDRARRVCSSLMNGGFSLTTRPCKARRLPPQYECTDVAKAQLQKSWMRSSYRVHRAVDARAARAVCVWRAQAIHDVPIAVAVLSPIFACQREAITQAVCELSSECSDITRHRHAGRSQRHHGSGLKRGLQLRE